MTSQVELPGRFRLAVNALCALTASVPSVLGASS